MVDSDPQGHATTGMGIDKSKVEKTLYQGLTENIAADRLILDSEIKSLKIIPSRMDLFRADVELIANPNKEKILSGFLNTIKDKFDYIVIDSPPSLSLLTVNAITAADSYLIPLQCEFYATESLGPLLKIFNIFKKRFNPSLELEGILLNMFRRDDTVSQQIVKNIRNFLEEMLFKVIIPNDTGIRNAAYYRKPILFHDILSNASQCYLHLASEIILKDKPQPDHKSEDFNLYETYDSTPEYSLVSGI